MIAYYKGNLSPVTARREYMRVYKVKKIKDCPSRSCIVRWVKVWNETASHHRKKPAVRAKRPETIEAETLIAAVLREDPLISIRKCAAATGQAQSTTRRIMNDLKENDKEIRRKVHVAEKKRAGGRSYWA